MCIRDRIKQLLREIKKDHIIIFSTHILQLATDLCDEIVVLNHGLLEGVDPALIHTCLLYTSRCV